MMNSAEPVPFVDLPAQQRDVELEVRRGLDLVLKDAAFIGGDAVADFEREYAEFVGTRHCVGVANGTDAIELALRASGVGPGDEVIIPANTFIATAEAVVRAGAVPVLVDVDEESLLMDMSLVEPALTQRTRAVVPVHLFGQAAAVELLRPLALEHDLVLLEDAAQSQGAKRHGVSAGALGDIAATSFYPGKNLGAAGDAGAVTTDDDVRARGVRVLGAHGSEHKYDHEVVGMNSRLDAVQAVVLRAKLSRLSEWNERRRAAAERYTTLLQDAPGVVTPTVLEGNQPVWHLYVVRVDRRDEVMRQLADQGISTGIHYPTPVHLTRAFAHLGLQRGAFPVSERAAEQIVSLPMFPHITADQQTRVVDALVRAVEAPRSQSHEP